MLKRWAALLCVLLLLPVWGAAESVVRLNTPQPAEGAEVFTPATPSPEPPQAPTAAPAAAPAEDPSGTPGVTASPPQAETGVRWADSQGFGIRHGPRDAKRVAITMDDCYERDKVRGLFDLCREYGVACTFYPLGDQLKAADAQLWREIAASSCEIGSHTNHHTDMNYMGYSSICIHIYRTQERLDEVLGYHYGIVSLRPPFGHYQVNERPRPEIVRACHRYGYEHVILWDVSQTDFEKAKTQVQNGSILLFHARKKDLDCLRQLIPWLIDQGYELVTVRELVGLPENEIGPEPYDHNRDG